MYHEGAQVPVHVRDDFTQRFDGRWWTVPELDFRVCFVL